MDYKQKYLKYKNKYLNLKSKMIGGDVSTSFETALRLFIVPKLLDTTIDLTMSTVNLSRILQKCITQNPTLSRPILFTDRFIDIQIDEHNNIVHEHLIRDANVAVRLEITPNKCTIACLKYVNPTTLQYVGRKIIYDKNITINDGIISEIIPPEVTNVPINMSEIENDCYVTNSRIIDNFNYN
jgi:hypothetical protein